MEVEDLHQTQQPPCKFSRIGNGRNDSSKIGTVNGIGGDHNHHHHRQFQEDAEEDGEIKMSLCNPAIGGAVVAADGPNSATTNRLRGWHHSRIIRVSRASGGKDRHSKVWTSKGLRDRRVRLSVTTAIQFYDLQDRLGYDQPSKAVEWLIKAAADAISELPSLNASFLDIPKQFADEKRGDATAAGEEQGFDSPDLELEDDQEPGDGSYNPNLNQNQNQNHQQLSLSKSASETSKGSGLSLSRSDVRVSRVKARERAREKAAAAKEKENAHHQQNLNTMSQNSTFTELLTGGIGGGIGNSNNNNNKNNNSNTTSTPATTSSSPSGSEVNLFHKATTASSWPLTAMDYFGPGLLGPPSSSRNNTQHHPSSAAILGQIHSIPQAMTSTTMSMSVPQFNLSSGGESTHSHGHHHHHHHHHHPHLHNQEQHLQHFPFVSDYLMPVATSTQGGGPGVDYNLNFTISSSSGLAGFNRGTLQSNSSPPSQTTTSLLPQQPRRFSSPIDGSSATHLPFFIGGSAPPLENHNHLFPSGLQLCYGDGSSSRHSDQKGKGKNN